MPLSTLITSSSTPLATQPVAVITANPAYGVIGSIIQLDGSQSTNPSAQPPKSGNDGSTTLASGVFTSASGNFTALDINRILTIEGTSADAGSYRILSIMSDTMVVLVTENGGGLTFAGVSPLQWSIVDNLTYSFTFIQTPIGSQVSLTGFRLINTDGSLVSFSPDIVGEYICGLVVNNGTFSSVQATTRVSIRAILVPVGRNIIPDGKWIWNYIRDVWRDVEGREWFETFWSALIQLVGADLLRLYQIDFNKSIANIQDYYQRRWLSYEPLLSLTEADLSFYLGFQCAGVDATTIGTGLAGELIMVDSTDVIVVLGSVLPNAAGQPLNIIFDSAPDGLPNNIGTYTVLTLNGAKNGYKLSTPLPNYGADVICANNVEFFYAAGSTTWSLQASRQLDYAELMSRSPSPIDDLLPLFASLVSSGPATAIRAGDVIQVPSGPNQGYYRILSRSGTYVTVDHAPIVGSTGLPTCSVFRPVGFNIVLPNQVLTDTFAVPYEPGPNDASLLAPGRVIIINGQCYTILRCLVDTAQVTPLTIIITTDGEILTGLNGQSWRAPDTLISASQNFETLGVAPGDLINVDITCNTSNAVARVYAQVVGVDGSALGFVLTNQPVTPGVVPPVPNQTYETLSSVFSINTVSENVDGSLSFSGNAQSMLTILNSGLFAKEYLNQLLTESDGFTLLNTTFYIHFRSIVRNFTVPVDETLLSIPVLQNWIVQPKWVTVDGEYFQVGPDGNQYPIAGPPLSLVENSDFLIDSETAFQGQMTFATGTDIITVQDGHFIDRGLRVGDQFIIQAPITLAGTYYIAAILSQTQLLLSTEVPLYVLGTIVTANVEIIRGVSGTFIRFVPGGFTALNPAPDRFWAEVSYFDNWPNVQNNFGILVGLTTADLEDISSTINYRQAVAGLMYAYTQGSAVNKVRLGAQIFLGLPFAEVAGVIQSIDTNYTVDVNGIPIQGRIVIEDTDANGNLLGTNRLYIYPIDVESELSGIETNPATDNTYAVGDSVKQFAILCKGVAVEDYISNPLIATSPSAAFLQQYHSMTLSANSTFFSLDELSLVSSFLRNITPSYIAFAISEDVEVDDTVTVQDAIYLELSNRLNPLTDDASMSIPTSIMFDQQTWDGTQAIFLDDSVYAVRFSAGGLVTTYNATPSWQANWPAGGFLSPEAGEGPVTRPGDYLYIRDGVNQSIYETSFYLITTVLDDYNVLVQPVTLPGSLTSAGFLTAVQDFAVIRKVVAELQTGSAGATTATNPIVQTDVGLQANYVSPGDTLFFSYSPGSWSRHTVLQVGPNTADTLAAGQMLVSPAPTITGSGLTYHIFRQAFMEAPFTEYPGTLVSNGTTYTSLDDIVVALLDIGDELQTTSQTVGMIRVKAIDPLGFVFTPVLPAGSYTVQICKPNHPTTPIGYNHRDFFDPFDEAAITLIPGSLTATAISGNANVTISSALGAAPLPGDVFVFTSGSNALVDVGYGPGACPIMPLSTTTNVVLSRPASTSESDTFQIIRRS
jgi:hypothetical protein